MRDTAQLTQNRNCKQVYRINYTRTLIFPRSNEECTSKISYLQHSRELIILVITMENKNLTPVNLQGN